MAKVTLSDGTTKQIKEKFQKYVKQHLKLKRYEDYKRNNREVERNV